MSKEQIASSPEARPVHFIEEIVAADTASGRFGGRVHTRFPPEPNGFLHIGHAKSICLNFGIAKKFGGLCNLRFDDTNPTREEQEYVDSIRESVTWLGFDWDDREFYASDYFDRLYAWAEELIRLGRAYVDDQSAEEIRAGRGTLTRPGSESPWRGRSPEESLDLFRRMKAGEFPDGSRVLRARIDMASPNIVLRDPTLYRIRHATHHRTGDTWCIYPMYDYAHCLSDSIEGITHSLCTLEFENNRALYDWVLDTLGLYHPQQIEFARLNLTYTVLSKRRLIQLVEEGHVLGWDDPRMPTIMGIRRRGYTPEAIRDFCERIGVAKAQNLVEHALLEHCLREDLNARAPRYMGVTRPLKVIVENYPEDQVEEFEFANHPERPELGTRKVPFCRELWVEEEDFREEAPAKWHRLAPGREVRLRYAYYLTCREAVKDASGRVVELRCTYDPASRGGWSADGRKVKGTLHWVSARHAVEAEVRLYDRLFLREDPMQAEEGGSFKDAINPDSLTVLAAKVEPAVAALAPESVFQFERLGYFVADRFEHAPGRTVYNRSVTLRDSWARIERGNQGK
jgi:glutaminyl-tRNA synthetase